MSNWNKTVSMQQRATRQYETWSYDNKAGFAAEYQVAVTTGKPFNVLGLKGTALDEITDYAGFIRNEVRRLYGDASRLETLDKCPCCRNKTESAKATLTVYEATYVTCPVCGHVFVGKQPARDQLENVFTESETHSQTYVDTDAAEARLTEIIKPKLDWVLQVYRDQYNSQPVSAVDVGAGGGHFVEGMKRAGINGVGYELSRASREFASQAFGLELKAGDFTNEKQNYDLVTFWGLLEYVPDPHRLLQAARRQLAKDSGLLVVEVPRYDALGTVAQSLNVDGIARHMDPSSHVNCFSDASLATLLVESGFSPVAVWYFGMDVYELLIQLALRMGNTDVLENAADMIPALQAALDAGRQCDDIVIAAVPAT